MPCAPRSLNPPAQHTKIYVPKTSSPKAQFSTPKAPFAPTINTPQRHTLQRRAPTGQLVVMRGNEGSARDASGSGGLQRADVGVAVHLRRIEGSVRRGGGGGGRERGQWVRDGEMSLELTGGRRDGEGVERTLHRIEFTF